MKEFGASGPDGEKQNTEGAVSEGKGDSKDDKFSKSHIPNSDLEEKVDDLKDTDDQESEDPSVDLKPSKDTIFIWRGKDSNGGTWTGRARGKADFKHRTKDKTDVNFDTKIVPEGKH